MCRENRKWRLSTEGKQQDPVEKELGRAGCAAPFEGLDKHLDLVFREDW